MTKEEKALQRKLEAQLVAERNAEKSKKVVKAGANLQSQWGRVVTNEQRLIDNGHFMMTGQQAKLSFLRGEMRKAKKQKNSKTVIVLVKK